MIVLAVRGAQGRENGCVTHLHIVHAHPSEGSFTREILNAFVGGLDDAGHTCTVSDPYAMGFRSELTLEEYERESGHRVDARDGESAGAPERWTAVKGGHLARAAEPARSI